MVLTGSRPMHDTRPGFTLLELLVVIAIIVVLLALLTPALDRAIYEAELVQCASRLRVWGGIAHAFGFDHRRDLPMAFGPQGAWTTMFDGPRGARVLDRISDNTAHEHNGQWKNYGTPWETWRSYGLTESAAVCPIWKGSGHAPSANYYYDDPNAPAPRRLADTGGETEAGPLFAGWGPQVWIGYQWIGGTDRTQPHTPGTDPQPQAQPNVFAWGNRPPASNFRNASAGSVLASDLLWMNNGWAPPPTNYRAIAHPSDHNPAQPQSMNIVFGDAHVELERETFFEQPQIFGDSGSPSQEQFSYQAGASYYWWGQ
jgi:prepilin-type N-terminal cleavage/methylation domain-containing protein